jgi:hypothetical protein
MSTLPPAFFNTNKATAANTMKPTRSFHMVLGLSRKGGCGGRRCALQHAG